MLNYVLNVTLAVLKNVQKGQNIKEEVVTKVEKN